MTSPSLENRRIRILLLASASDCERHLADIFLDNPEYEIEIVSGDQAKTASPHAASWSRLRNLRQRLERGDFDLVLSGPVQQTVRPPHEPLAAQWAQAFRTLTSQGRRLDTFWTPWLLGGKLKGKVPLAVVDFLDSAYVLPKDYALLKAATLYFKLNLYFWPRRSLMPLESAMAMRRVTPYSPKLRPITQGIARRSIPDQVRPMRERDIDICCTGSFTPNRHADDTNSLPGLTFNPIRKDIYDRCLNLKERCQVFCVDGTVPEEEYRELLQRSKLVICTEGFGCETRRHYDVAASGAVPLINWPYAQNDHPLQPDVHAFYFSLIGDDFERSVVRALGDPARLEEVARNARAFTIEHKECRLVGERVIRETLRQHQSNLQGN